MHLLYCLGVFKQPSLDLSSPEIHIQPKLVESSEMGVSASELGYTVDAFTDGAYAGDYFVDGDKIDLTIIGKQAFERRTQDLLVGARIGDAAHLDPVTTRGQGDVARWRRADPMTCASR